MGSYSCALVGFVLRHAKGLTELDMSDINGQRHGPTGKAHKWLGKLQLDSNAQRLSLEMTVRKSVSKRMCLGARLEMLPGAYAIGIGLHYNHSLVRLDLSDNNLVWENALCIFSPLVSANRTLRHLNLNGNFAVGFYACEPEFTSKWDATTFFSARAWMTNVSTNEFSKRVKTVAALLDGRVMDTMCAALRNNPTLAEVLMEDAWLGYYSKDAAAHKQRRDQLIQAVAARPSNAPLKFGCPGENW